MSDWLFWLHTLHPPVEVWSSLHLTFWFSEQNCICVNWFQKNKHFYYLQWIILYLNTPWSLKRLSLSYYFHDIYHFECEKRQKWLNCSLCSLYTVHKSTKEWITLSYPKTYKIHILYNENIYQGMLHIYIQPMNANCWCNSG